MRDVNEDSDALLPRIVDFTHWSGGLLTLRLEPSGLLDLEVGRASWSSELSIETSDGLPVWSGALEGRPWSSFRLARGSYRVTWKPAGQPTISREVTVGAQPIELSLKAQ